MTKAKDYNIIHVLYGVSQTLEWVAYRSSPSKNQTDTLKRCSQALAQVRDLGLPKEAKLVLSKKHKTNVVLKHGAFLVTFTPSFSGIKVWVSRIGAPALKYDNPYDFRPDDELDDVHDIYTALVDIRTELVLDDPK